MKQNLIIGKEYYLDETKKSFSFYLGYDQTHCFNIFELPFYEKPYWNSIHKMFSPKFNKIVYAPIRCTPFVESNEYDERIKFAHTCTEIYNIEVEHANDGIKEYNEDAFQKALPELLIAIKNANKHNHNPRVGEQVHGNENCYYITEIIHYDNGIRFYLSEEQNLINQ